MPRTSDKLVRKALEVDDADLKLGTYIDTANALTNYVVGKDTAGILGDALPQKIETYLAAHFVALYDEAYRRASGSTGRKSATMQGKTEMHLDATLWGQQAKVLDVTGTLAKLDDQAKNDRVKAKFIWMGTQQGRGNFRGSEDFL